MRSSRRAVGSIYMRHVRDGLNEYSRAHSRKSPMPHRESSHRINEKDAYTGTERSRSRGEADASLGAETSDSKMLERGGNLANQR